MDLEREYRKAVFGKLHGIMEAAKENALRQEPGEHTNAAALLLDNIAKMFKTMDDVKDSNAFIAVSNGLDQVLEDQFFSKVYGPRVKKQDVPGKLPEMSSEHHEERQPSASAEEGVSFDIRMVGLDNVEKLPIEIREKVGKTLMGLGIPVTEINAKLNLKL